MKLGIRKRKGIVYGLLTIGNAMYLLTGVVYANKSDAGIQVDESNKSSSQSNKSSSQSNKSSDSKNIDNDETTKINRQQPLVTVDQNQMPDTGMATEVGITILGIILLIMVLYAIYLGRKRHDKKK